MTFILGVVVLLVLQHTGPWGLVLCALAFVALASDQK